MIRLTDAESRALTAGYDAACRSVEGWIEVEKAVEHIIAARVNEALESAMDVIADEMLTDEDYATDQAYNKAVKHCWQTVQNLANERSGA